MRLIDADKAKYSLWGFERYTGIDEMPMEYAEEIIDKQPTVEAIPVELIYKIRNLYLKNDCIISAGVCNEILNMWGAENG